jgi:hypothetical protein
MLLAVAVCSFPSRTWASTPNSRTLSFNELPFQPVDGLHFAGVTFDYKLGGIDSTEAFYNSFGPGMLSHIEDPSLTGDSAGVLTLQFDIPTAVLEFGVALNTATALMPGLSVELFNSEMSSLGITPVGVSPVTGNLGFSENRFIYSGQPIRRAVIDFAHQPGSFALDDLTFLVVPEPTCACIATMGIALFLTICRFPFSCSAEGLHHRP